MTHFRIAFSHPWFLLLLIPAVFFALFPYFRLAKKYRRNRNRIVSVVFHTIIMVLCIGVLSGITFRYEVPNTNNEVLLLVDASHSSATTQQTKDEFVKSVLDESDSRFKVGVVTFGYDQVYAAPFDGDRDAVYANYIRAEKPDEGATDIAGALEYARTLFRYPQTAKIVLISDGVQTDGNALPVIKSLTAEGIRVDTVYFPAAYDREVRLVDAQLPDYNVATGTAFNIGISVQSSHEANATLSLFDNGVAVVNSESVRLNAGVQALTFSHTFETTGLHELQFRLQSDGDTIAENNVYCTYMYLQTFDRVLLVERTMGESDRFRALLDKDYNITVRNISDAANFPVTLDALRAYDEVVLFNISRSEMPAGFETALYSYVNEVGGGLFTVGGSRLEGGVEIANTYNRDDMRLETGAPSLFQQMLPVQAVNYTPPLGVIIIVDKSGSMDTPASGVSGDKTALDLAKEGAISCAEALSERDYIGVMTLEDEFGDVLPLTPRTNLSQIRTAIEGIGDKGGGTVFAGAIERAGVALGTLDNVEKKHIILVSDGDPGDKPEDYIPKIENNARNGITFSIVMIGGGDTTAMEAAVKAGRDISGGGNFCHGNATDIQHLMREDLKAPEITDVVMEEFRPKIKDHTAAVAGIKDEEVPVLQGFYGTKLKDGAAAPLMGEYVPVYAQWKFGKGSVGSFMCDLSGKWSNAFLTEAAGVRILQNIVNALFPTEEIRARDIDISMEENNCRTQLGIVTDLAEGETVEVEITSPQGEARAAGEPQKYTFTAADGFGRITLDNRVPGVYAITAAKRDAAGALVSTRTVYKAFSYSAEYNAFVDPEIGETLLKSLAQDGNGAVVSQSEPWTVYGEAVRTLAREKDPRLVFVIIAAVLFLLDIAARKFKFKWPHELVRDYKAKKALVHGGTAR